MAMSVYCFNVLLLLEPGAVVYKLCGQGHMPVFIETCVGLLTQILANRQHVLMLNVPKYIF